MGNQKGNQKAPPISLISMQRNEKKSPLMNWMEKHRQPEPAPTGRFRLNFPSLSQRILLLPLRRMSTFLRSHIRVIGAIVVVAFLALLFVFRPDGTANMQLDKSEIHFDDVTIHLLNSSSVVTSGWLSQEENNLPNPSGLDSSVSAAQREIPISPIQPGTFTIHNTSDGKHGAWLTGTIEFDETLESRSPQSQNKIGQRIEYFSQKRD